MVVTHDLQVYSIRMKPRIRSYLTGTVLPKYDFLASISERLGVSVDWLLTGEGEMLKADREAEIEAHKANRFEALPVYENVFYLRI